MTKMISQNSSEEINEPIAVPIVKRAANKAGSSPLSHYTRHYFSRRLKQGNGYCYIPRELDEYYRTMLEYAPFQKSFNDQGLCNLNQVELISATFEQPYSVQRNHKYCIPRVAFFTKIYKPEVKPSNPHKNCDYLSRNANVEEDCFCNDPTEPGKPNNYKSNLSCICKINGYNFDENGDHDKKTKSYVRKTCERAGKPAELDMHDLVNIYKCYIDFNKVYDYESKYFGKSVVGEEYLGANSPDVQGFEYQRSGANSIGQNMNSLMASYNIFPFILLLAHLLFYMGMFKKEIIPKEKDN